MQKTLPIVTLCKANRTFVRSNCSKRQMYNAFDDTYRRLAAGLDKIAPRFELESGKVTVLREPADFYRTLKEKIIGAKSRIFLSTLYVGKSETELVDTLREALQRNPKVKVSILTDALRGTRETPRASSASLLAPLISEFGRDRVEVSMYHTPNLHGLKKKLIPRRFDEGWGLQHMKLYGTDDEIILSGANLSNDYFTNRQDRYHLFRSREMTDFCAQLHHAVSSVSFSVLPDKESEGGYRLDWSQSRPCPPPTEDPKAYKRYAGSVLRKLIRPSVRDHCAFDDAMPPATVVYPIVQMTQLLGDGASTEQPALNLVLDMLHDPQVNKGTRWTFTAGYFNVFREYRERLLRASGQGTVITASPDANGFFGSSFPSGMLPAAYSLLSKRFLEDVQACGKGESVSLREWRKGVFGTKDRWTYHAKGLWIWPDTAASRAGPSLTVIGSSNYTRRAQARDLEVNALVITSDPLLQKELADEIKHLSQHTKAVTVQELETTDRKADLKTRISLWLTQSML